MPPFDPFESRLAASWPPLQWCELTVVVGVSGGADSVALLHALTRIRQPGPGRLHVAHFHHRVRGKAADQDAAFVQELSARLGLTCHAGYAATRCGAPEEKASELTLRRQRYHFFRQTAHQLGARYVVVAHTADDQAETVLHRILRGTGVGGLAGIPRVRPLSPAVTLLRPALGITRQELRAYLTRRGELFREDASNADIRYTRNRIRKQLLPRLARDFNPQVTEALTRLASQAAESRAVIESIARDLLDRSLRCAESRRVQLDRATLRAAPLYLVRESLLLLWRDQDWPAGAMSAGHWTELARRVVSEDAVGASRTDFPGAVRVVLRDAEVVHVERVP